MTAQEFIDREARYGAHNYHPYLWYSNGEKVFMSGIQMEKSISIFFLLIRL